MSASVALFFHFFLKLMKQILTFNMYSRASLSNIRCKMTMKKLTLNFEWQLAF